MGLAGDEGGGRGYRLSEIVEALSHALDLTEGQPVGHARRTAAIGLEVAARMDLPEERLSSLLYALLLKDAGCSSAAARISRLFGADDIVVTRDFKRVDWDEKAQVLGFLMRRTAPDASLGARARRLLHAVRHLSSEGQAIVETRCERGAEVVAKLGCPDDAAEAVRSLDEHWDGAGRPDGLVGEEIPLLARIAGLSQSAEVFHAVGGWEAARRVVARRRGRWFDPRVADAYLSIGPDDPLWTRMLPDELSTTLATHDSPETWAVADEARLDQVAMAFADVIDAKSPFTARHSSGVADHTVAIAQMLELPPVHVRTLRRAALLHDVGKLGVSNRVLDKPGRLTEDEFAAVKRHTLYGEQILGDAAAFADILAPTAAHHERLDGSGYHRGLRADRITPFVRILTVADVYEALTTARPYRGPMDPDDALAILWQGAGSAVDPEYVSALGETVA